MVTRDSVCVRVRVGKNQDSGREFFGESMKWRENFSTCRVTWKGVGASNVAEAWWRSELLCHGFNVIHLVPLITIRQENLFACRVPHSQFIIPNSLVRFHEKLILRHIAYLLVRTPSFYFSTHRSLYLQKE